MVEAACPKHNPCPKPESPIRGLESVPVIELLQSFAVHPLQDSPILAFQSWLLTVNLTAGWLFKCRLGMLFQHSELESNNCNLNGGIAAPPPETWKVHRHTSSSCKRRYLVMPAKHVNGRVIGSRGHYRVCENFLRNQCCLGAQSWGPDCWWYERIATSVSPMCHKAHSQHHERGRRGWMSPRPLTRRPLRLWWDAVVAIILPLLLQELDSSD